jgi:hypothetical protein
MRRPPGARLRARGAMTRRALKLTGAVRLGRHDQVVVGAHLARSRQDVVEHEAAVLAVNHQHHRLLVDWVAGLGADAGLPVLGEKRLQGSDLRVELGGAGALQRDLAPRQALRRGHGLRGQAGSLGIVQVGHHQHRPRMLGEAVRYLLQRQAHVLEADLFADDVERHVSEAAVHGTHDAGQHGAVADARIEHPDRGRARVDVGQLQADSAGDYPLLAAGADKQEVLLAVVEKAEVALGIGGWRRRLGVLIGDGIGLHEGAHPLHGLECDPAAVAQAARQLAVVDGAAPERGLGHAAAAAVVRNFVQQALRARDRIAAPNCMLHS